MKITFVIDSSSSSSSSSLSFAHTSKEMNQPPQPQQRALPSISHLLPEHFNSAAFHQQRIKPNRLIQQPHPLLHTQPHLQPIYVQYQPIYNPIGQFHPNIAPQQIRPRPSFAFDSFKLDKTIQPFPTVVAPPVKKVKIEPEPPAPLDAAVKACIEAAKALIPETSMTVGSGSTETIVKTNKSQLGQSQQHQQICLNFRNFSINLGTRATNLTSNQYGTATADKSHFASVMNDSVICTSLGVLEHFSDEYQPTVNNKLKPLKFMEFLQERFQMHFCGSKSVLNQLKRLPDTEQIAIVYRMSEALRREYGHLGELHLLLKGPILGIAIYQRESGKRTYSNSMYTGRFVSPDLDLIVASGSNHDVIKSGIQDGDLIIQFRGNCLRVCDALAAQLISVPAGSDLDEIVEVFNSKLDPKIANIASVSVLGSKFDEFYLQDHQIQHSLHTERKGLLAIDQPWSYAITKHCFVLRPYLAMLYADASKINRFCPTIEFVIRKAASQSLLGIPLTEGLTNLSEVQHMTGVMIRPNGKLRYWGTGGAFVVLVDRRDASSGNWPITFPGLEDVSQVQWRSDSPVSVGEVDYHPGQMIFLMCPSVRKYWKADEIRDILGRPNRTCPEKLTNLLARLTDEVSLRSGIGAFDII